MVLYHESRKLLHTVANVTSWLKKKNTLIHVATWILSVTDFMQYGRRVFLLSSRK